MVSISALENICPGPGRSAFSVRILDIGETFSKGQTDMRPFLVHGATLDALFQSWTSSTFYNGQIRSEKPFAPTFVGEMEVTADFPAPEGQAMPGFCLSEPRGPNELSASTFLFNPSLSKLHLSVNDFRIPYPSLTLLCPQWTIRALQARSPSMCAGTTHSMSYDRTKRRGFCLTRRLYHRNICSSLFAWHSTRIPQLQSLRWCRTTPRFLRQSSIWCGQILDYQTVQLCPSQSFTP